MSVFKVILQLMHYKLLFYLLTYI